MKWSDLTKNQQVLAIVAAVVALILVGGGAYAIGRGAGDDGSVEEESSATPEATETTEPEVAEVAVVPPPAQPDPEAPPAEEPGPSYVRYAYVRAMPDAFRDQWKVTVENGVITRVEMIAVAD